MNPSTAERDARIRDGGESPSRERVRKTMTALTRARRLQLLVDHGFAGLTLGLTLATAVVLVARLVPSSPYSPLQLAVVALIIALVAALIMGWHGRPDTLAVAIRADLALRLKQRLSTAWEYMTVHGDGELAERLAAHAVKAGLPPRAGLVFPLRVNRWGQLAPLAATALLLVSVLDLNWLQARLPRAIDERVVHEGQRLTAFGREMQARATREQLPLSAKQAELLERLATRMESGGLTRSESLGLLHQLAKSLDAEQRQALAGKERNPIASARPDGDEASLLAPSRNPREMLERMQRGDMDSTDTRALSQYLNDAARSGIPRGQAEEAPRRHQGGDDAGAREILEKMANIERARREHEELQGAREQVRLAQENLAGSQAGIRGGRGLPTDMEEGEVEDREDDRIARSDANRRRTTETRGASRYGAQSDSSVAGEREPAPSLSDAGKTGPILKPQGQVREGEELVTHGQVLPRPGRPNVENIPMRAEFASQVEAVLSNEQYPAHSREFIRRYFLSLSEGTRAPREPNQGVR